VADAGLHGFDQQVEGLLEEALARGEGGCGRHSSENKLAYVGEGCKDEFRDFYDFFRQPRLAALGGCWRRPRPLPQEVSGRALSNCTRADCHTTPPRPKLAK
jgi:hypothetical protein